MHSETATFESDRTTKETLSTTATVPTGIREKPWPGRNHAIRCESRGFTCLRNFTILRRFWSFVDVDA